MKTYKDRAGDISATDRGRGAYIDARSANIKRKIARREERIAILEKEIKTLRTQLSFVGSLGGAKGRTRRI